MRTLRRALAGMVLATSPASAATTTNWNFRVLLDDQPIGEHSFVVAGDDTHRVVDSNAGFRVKALFFEVYRYRHHNREVWRDGCLESIASDTDDNGEVQFVRGARGEAGLELETHQGKESANGCVRTFSYWDLASLRRADRLLNAQTGDLVSASLSGEGPDTIEVRGTPRRADRFRLRAEDLEIVLWYTPEGDWLQLDSITTSGERLRYRLR